MGPFCLSLLFARSCINTSLVVGVLSEGSCLKGLVWRDLVWRVLLVGAIHLGPGPGPIWALLGPFIWALLGPFIWALGPGPFGAHSFGPGPNGPILRFCHEWGKIKRWGAVRHVIVSGIPMRVFFIFILSQKKRLLDVWVFHVFLHVLTFC